MGSKLSGGKIYIGNEEFDRMRNEEGLNQKQIAKALCTSETKISNYVKERRKRENCKIPKKKSIHALNKLEGN